MITVRPFEERDAKRASEILIEAFRGFLGDRVDGVLSEHFSPENLIKEADTSSTFNVSKIFVAEDDGALAGVVKATAGTFGLGLFDYIGVDPQCQTRGTGSALMKKAEEFWAEHKQRKIATGVSAHNKKALMYYLKHDFVPEGYRRDHFFEGVDEIVLGRFLGSVSKPKTN